jgi:lipopolysaccharide assembly protein A
MRYVYIALVVAVTAIVALFKVQNLETATVSFLSASITLPVSVLLFAVYVLGMFSGGFVFALLRTWVRGAAQSR